VLYDGAHTVAAMQRLARRLESQAPAAIVFGATSGRDAGLMLAPFEPLQASMVLTRVPGDRGLSTSELQSALPPALRPRALGVESPDAALARARHLAGDDRLVVVTGSLHLVGCLLKAAGG
jgi:dihydrofolate synthase / folylpolyglutamate synthase